MDRCGCGAVVPRKFAARGLSCGICQINEARQFPGVSGVQHANEVDPSNPDPAKALGLLLKECNQSKDPRMHMTNAQVDLVARVHQKDFDAQTEVMQAVPDRTIARQHERIQQQTNDDLNEFHSNQRRIREGLERHDHLFQQFKRDTPAGQPNTVSDT